MLPAKVALDVVDVEEDMVDVVETDPEEPRATGSVAVLASAALEETDVGKADEENGVPGI